MKRKIALVLAAVVAVASLVGCNGNKKPLSNNSSESQLSSNDNSSASQESSSSTSEESNSSKPETVVPEVTFTQEDIENSKKWLTITPSDNFVVGCSVEATKIVIPDHVVGIGELTFKGLNNLKAVKIPNSVTEIGSMAFCECTGLTSIEIPDSVTTIYYNAFKDCIGLTSVAIPDSVTKISENAFEGCENISVTYKGKTYDYAHIEELYTD